MSEREYGRELRAMRLAFRVEHGREPTRVIWSHDIENDVIEQERKLAAMYPDQGMELDPSAKSKGLKFISIPGPPGTFYVDDKEGDEP